MNPQNTTLYQAKSAPTAPMDTRKLVLIYWGPALLWIALISYFSGGTFNSVNTSGFLVTILKAFGWKLTALDFANLHFLIRKFMHFFSYAVLSALLFRAWRGQAERTRWKPKWAGLALALTLAVSLADELHQFYVPGRTGSQKDVLLDMAGALFAQLMIVVCLTHSGKRSQAE